VFGVPFIDILVTCNVLVTFPEVVVILGELGIAFTATAIVPAAPVLVDVQLIPPAV
jgi:predicted TIM-barrel fold metal-dependent hydrolase